MALLGVPAAAAGCTTSDRPNEVGSGPTTTAAEEPSPGAGPSGLPAPSGVPAPSGAPAPFCEQAEEFNRVLGTVDASRIESFDVISEQVTALSLVAPPELAEDLAVMSGYWERLAGVDASDASEVSSLVQRDPAAEAAGQRVVGYLVDQCGIVPVG